MIVVVILLFCCFFFKQNTAYEMRISDWSSDVCSSDLFVLRSGPQSREDWVGTVSAGGRFQASDSVPRMLHPHHGRRCSLAPFEARCRVIDDVDRRIYAWRRFCELSSGMVGQIGDRKSTRLNSSH